MSSKNPDTKETMNIDHVVLWVDNALSALDFYVNIVGMQPVRQQEFAEGTAPFPSVRLNDSTILDLMNKDVLSGVQKFTGGDHSGGLPINHICLSLLAEDYSALRARLISNGVELTSAGEHAFGAQGLAERSEYFCDPYGNVIEIRYYA
jgi:catechol 2,3-dioxygenase-like lactoylglutathione lyase family enzyme